MLLYSLEQQNITVNDSWYAEDNGIYHSYFLEFDRSLPEEYQWSKQTIGHMTSNNLIDWNYEGTVIDSTSAPWLDMGVATGSIVKYNDLWYMIFTAKPQDPNKRGLAIAVSHDLMKWEIVGDGPVIPCNHRYEVNYNGKMHQARIMADPYVYPEPVDGYYHIFVNSHLSHYPLNQRGAQLVFITKDFKTYECKTVAAVGYCDRIETPQVWKHGGKYYMYAGSVYGDELAQPIAPAESYVEWVDWKLGHSVNTILVADHIDGPYRYLGELEIPDDEKRSYLYIAKVVTDPCGDDVMLINDIPFGVRGPFKMKYHEDKEGFTLESASQY